VKATTDGVVRDPSALGITVGWPASVAAITEFVVPRSMPTAVAIAAPSLNETSPMAWRQIPCNDSTFAVSRPPDLGRASRPGTG
jgi:hypothetical protein